MAVYNSTSVKVRFCLCKYINYAALELQAKLPCWFSLYECVQPYSTIKTGNRRFGLYTRRVLLKGTSNQRQANDFLRLGNKLCTCHTRHTSNTHTNNFNIWIFCVQNRRACVGVRARLFPLQAQSDLSSLDLGLFLARPPGLRHLQRERKRQHNENRKPFLDDRKKTKKERWFVRFCNCSDIRERPVL